MFYDMKPAEVNAPGGLTLKSYKTILDFFEIFMPKELIIMGMEPGGQAGKNIWPGMQVSR